jgi:hypothetical protein
MHLMKRNVTALIVAATSIALFAVSASACTFTFSYESISAPIGTVGEAGIRVQKTHANCTLSSMDDYVIDGDGIQILGETAWEDLGGDLYEKWVQISLAEEGEGYLRISKTCIKEGYEEKVLPIAILAPGDQAAWTAAWNGDYPFEAPDDVQTVVDRVTVADGSLDVAGLTLALPEGAALPSDLPETLRVFYTQATDGPVALLVVGDGVFLRFDHLIA